MKKICLIIGVVIFSTGLCRAQDVVALMQKVKEKLDKVNDYEASGKMKMNITFIKAPVADVKIYYKKPGKIRIHNESGISLVPKGSVNINLSSIIGNVDGSDIIDVGKDAKTGLRMVRLLPKDENAEVVLSTLHIDEQKLLVIKAKTTTRENGTYELELTYGKYGEFGLADKLVFLFNTKDYKLPRGVAFDYEAGGKKPAIAEKPKDTKGTVEITYSSYVINKGVPDKIFDNK